MIHQWQTKLLRDSGNLVHLYSRVRRVFTHRSSTCNNDACIWNESKWESDRQQTNAFSAVQVGGLERDSCHWFWCSTLTEYKHSCVNSFFFFPFITLFVEKSSAAYFTALASSSCKNIIFFVKSRSVSVFYLFFRKSDLTIFKIHVMLCAMYNYTHMYSRSIHLASTNITTHHCMFTWSFERFTVDLCPIRWEALVDPIKKTELSKYAFTQRIA